jgi:hypothetical protein
MRSESTITGSPSLIRKATLTLPSSFGVTVVSTCAP